MTEQEKKDIQQKINEVLAIVDCPICHHREFVIADSYFMNLANEDYTKSPMLYKRSIPAVGVICKSVRCSPQSIFAFRRATRFGLDPPKCLVYIRNTGQHTRASSLSIYPPRRISRFPPLLLFK